MKITTHSFLTESFGFDINKIKYYLNTHDINEVYINSHLTVNSSNYILNFTTYINLSHE